MSSNLSEKIQRVIIHENRNFQKVITDVADGFRRSGFFTEPNWRDMLLQGFERKVPSNEIPYNTRVHTPALSDNSFTKGLAAFRKGLAAQSTPLAVATGRIGQKQTQAPRNKRAPTLPDDGGQQDENRMPKRARGASVDEMEAARVLVELNRTEWRRILPAVNEQQNAIGHKDIFETSIQVVGLATPFRKRPAESAAAPQTSNVRDQNQTATNSPITKRRNAIYIPEFKRSTDLVQVVQRKTAPVTLVASNGSKNAKSTNANGSVPAAPAGNAVLPITNRRMTRKQSQLRDAFLGINTNSGISERRNTGLYPRTSVVFTMVDSAQYKNILHTYNIFVTDGNEKYDYVITDRICRSPKFLSAVVSCKPIVSVEWLEALDQKKTWLDPLNYLLKDDKGEKEFGFNLSATLLKAKNKRLFENYSILVTAHTTIAPVLLKDVIFNGGGKFIKTNLKPRRGDQVLCISNEIDKKTWPTLLRRYPDLKKIISLDGFSKMIFQYTHDIDPIDILHEI